MHNYQVPPNKNLNLIGLFTKFITIGVEKISGSPGKYTATIRKNARGVNSKCTGCGDCVEACPVERPDEYNLRMGTTKAIFLPYPMAYPMQYVIDGNACPGTECGKCVPACPYGSQIAFEFCKLRHHGSTELRHFLRFIDRTLQ